MMIVLLMLACSGAALAQRGGQTPSQATRPVANPQTNTQQKEDTLSVNVNLVDLLYTVADKKGRFITSLRKEDFKVYEDDKNQVISNFTAETDLPLTIALLVDTSGSIRDKLRFEQEAAIEFFYSTLHRGKDKAMVISFDSGVDLLQDFTDNPETLADAVRKIRAGGGTSLYDAVYLAVNEKLASQPGRLVIVFNKQNFLARICHEPPRQRRTLRSAGWILIWKAQKINCDKSLWREGHAVIYHSIICSLSH